MRGHDEGHQDGSLDEVEAETIEDLDVDAEAEQVRGGYTMGTTTVST